jgi:hypothetical protein
MKRVTGSEIKSWELTDELRKRSEQCRRDVGKIISIKLFSSQLSKFSNSSAAPVLRRLIFLILFPILGK